METIKFPISFTADRQVVKLVKGTEEYINQIISMCILTEPFILPLTPDFGVSDPTFATISPAQLIIAVNKYIPEVTIVNMSSSMEQESGLVNIQFVYNR